MKKLIARDVLILIAVSSVITIIFWFVTDILNKKKGGMDMDPLVTATIQNNLEKVKTHLGEQAFKKNPEGTATLSEFYVKRANRPDENNRTPLMWAAYFNLETEKERVIANEKRPPIAAYLLEHGADPSLKDNDGWTALHWAAWSGAPGIVQMLTTTYKSQIDISAQEKEGWTPLMLAVYRGEFECVNILLAAGADPSLRNKTGHDALQLAERGMIEYPDWEKDYAKIIAALPR